MIENLQRQVAKLTQLLEAQNLDMHHDIDDDDSESSFTCITILFWFGNIAVGMSGMELPKFAGTLIALQVHHHMEWYCQDNGKEVGGLDLSEIFVDARSA